MYDDILNSIAYRVVMDDKFIDGVFKYAEHFGISFFAVLGIVIGIRFFKSVFDL